MSIELGTAGEHIVCADILLQGYRASLAGQGLPYDVVADIDRQLLRIAVKSASQMKQRPPREGNRLCYGFGITRPRHLKNGKSDNRPYSSEDVDIVAMCALDERVVAYCHIKECATTMHFDPPGATQLAMYRGKIPGRERKTFEAFSLQRAFEIHNGLRVPTVLRGR